MTEEKTIVVKSNFARNCVFVIFILVVGCIAINLIAGWVGVEILDGMFDVFNAMPTLTPSP